MTSNDNQYENCIDDTHMSEKEIWDVWKMNFILWAIILLFLINIVTSLWLITSLPYGHNPTVILIPPTITTAIILPLAYYLQQLSNCNSYLEDSL